MLLGILYLLTVMSCIMAQSSSDAFKNSKGGCVIDGRSIRCRKANSTQLDTILSSVTNSSGNTAVAELTEELTVLNSQIAILREGWLGQRPLRNLRITYSHLADWHFLPHSLNGLESSLKSLSLEGNFLTTIPQTIQNLSALRDLDLSHNNIQMLPPGTVFFNLHQLLHLNLAYNNLGYLETVQQRQTNTSTTTLLLSLFNLEPLREGLETLQLQNNNLTRFPEQFLRPFPRLFSLNLAENRLTNIPRDAFQYMPELEILHLARNELTTIYIRKLPSKLNLQGNPLRCDCHAVWLQQWLHQTARNRTDFTTTIPLCQTPLRFKGLSLASLTSDLLCSTMPGNEFRYVGDEDLDKLPQLSLHINPSFTAPFTTQEDGKHYLKLTVKPNVSDTNSHRKWILAYRRLGNDYSAQYTPIPSTPFNDSYLTITPNASYAICIAVEDLDIYYIHPNFCQEVLLPSWHADSTKMQTPAFNHETSHSPFLHFTPTPNSVQLQWTDADCTTYYGWLVRHRAWVANNEPPWILSNLSSCTAELQDLRSSHVYQVCWKLPLARNWLCQQIRTLPDLKTAFMTQEVALAAGVSSSTTFILITLVGCCCCRRKKTSKTAKKAHKIPEPFVSDSQKPTLSTNSLSLHHRKNGRSVYASLTRFYHKCQNVRSSASKQAQQDATFEATKRYLQYKTQDFAFGSLTLRNTHTETSGVRRNKPSSLALWTSDSYENTSTGYLTPKSNQRLILRPAPNLKLAPSQTLRAPARRYGTVASNWRLDSRDKVRRRTPTRLSRNKYYTWTTTASRLLPTRNQTLIKTKNQMPNNANNQNLKRQLPSVTPNPLYLFPQPLSNSELHF